MLVYFVCTFALLLYLRALLILGYIASSIVKAVFLCASLELEVSYLSSGIYNGFIVSTVYRRHIEAGNITETIAFETLAYFCIRVKGLAVEDLCFQDQAVAA